MDSLDSRPEGEKRWATKMPLWQSKGHHRGLLPWGQHRKKKGTAVIPTGGIPQVCRHAVIKAIAFYFQHLGLPPVKAGESMRKAIEAGRYKGPGDPDDLVEGATRGQNVLVELLPPEGPMDLWSPFVLVVAAAYCHYIDPPVDDGTDASYAVVGFFQEKRVKTKLLAHVRVPQYMPPLRTPTTYVHFIRRPKFA